MNRLNERQRRRSKDLGKYLFKKTKLTEIKQREREARAQGRKQINRAELRVEGHESATGFPSLRTQAMR